MLKKRAGATAGTTALVRRVPKTRRYVLRVSQFQAHCFISQLVTVRTDYPDCLSIHRPIHAQHETDTFLFQKVKKKGDACFGGWACRDGTAKKVNLDTHSVTTNTKRHATFVAAGRYTTVIVDNFGDVLVWGLNLCGAGLDGSSDDLKTEQDVRRLTQRLRGNLELAATPRVVLGLDGKGFFSNGRDDGPGIDPEKSLEVTRAEVVAVGYVHLVVLTKNGTVFTCDTGFDGYAGGLSVGGKGYVMNQSKQMGRNVKSVAEALTPGEVLFPNGGTKIVAIDAGRCHAVVADETGRVFSFGCGALGGDSGEFGLPKEIDFRKVLRVETADSRVDEESGQSSASGTSTSKSSETKGKKPEGGETKARDEVRHKEDDNAPHFVVDVAAGEYFSLVTTLDGKVFGKYFPPTTFRRLIAHTRLTLSFLQTGLGDGNSGQLGVSSEALKSAREKNRVDEQAPVEIPTNLGRKGATVGQVLTPIAGYQHAAAIVERKEA